MLIMEREKAERWGKVVPFFFLIPPSSLLEGGFFTTPATASREVTIGLGLSLN